MNESATLLLAGFAGLLLGALFFGGLWWTVQKGIASHHPALWFFGSFIARMSIVLAGFYFIGSGHWQRLLSCLVGLLLARLIAMRLTRPPVEIGHTSAEEAGHATQP
jgi:F1F0 ATPase subunit 2